MGKSHVLASDRLGQGSNLGTTRTHTPSTEYIILYRTDGFLNPSASVSGYHHSTCTVLQ
jgi:hypothetical protein